MLSSQLADSRRLFGNEFQDIGPATAKARRPNVPRRWVCRQLFVSFDTFSGSWYGRALGLISRRSATNLEAWVIHLGANRYLLCMTLYRQLIVTFALSSAVSEIAGSVYADSHFFHSSLLFRIKFGCVLFGVDPWLMSGSAKSEETNQSLNYFQIIPTNMITTPRRHGQTDRRLSMAMPRSA